MQPTKQQIISMLEALEEVEAQIARIRSDYQRILAIQEIQPEEHNYHYHPIGKDTVC